MTRLVIPGYGEPPGPEHLAGAFRLLQAHGGIPKNPRTRREDGRGDGWLGIAASATPLSEPDRGGKGG
jgi:hypothetical protein